MKPLVYAHLASLKVSQAYVAMLPYKNGKRYLKNPISRRSPQGDPIYRAFRDTVDPWVVEGEEYILSFEMISISLLSSNMIQFAKLYYSNPPKVLELSIDDFYKHYDKEMRKWAPRTYKAE